MLKKLEDFIYLYIRLENFMASYHDRDLIELDISNNNCTDSGILLLCDLCCKFRVIGTLSIQNNKFDAKNVTEYFFL